MRKIFKYEVPIKDEFTLELPIAAKILTVQVQGGEPFLWAMVLPDVGTQPRRFRLAGTGHPIKKEDELSYIGTFQMHGWMVFHLFEAYD